jgi:iron complex transport system ATP-binding protein
MPPERARTAPSTGPAPTLQTQALTVRLGRSLVLDRVDCRIGLGWTAVVGPNGAGKSTLLRALAGLQGPTDGGVLLDGVDLDRLDARQRARSIAWLAQGTEHPRELTVRETVGLGRLPHLGLIGRPSPADAAALDRALAATGCTSLADRRLEELSGGERQRVLLARALACEAPVLLMDEPTAHLDPTHQVALAHLSRTLAATRTVVTVLHDITLALAADRVLLLQAGRLHADAPPGEPTLHRALRRAFGGALHITQLGTRWIAHPALDTDTDTDTDTDNAQRAAGAA